MYIPHFAGGVTHFTLRLSEQL